MIDLLQQKLSDLSLSNDKGQKMAMRLMGKSDFFEFDKAGRTKLAESLFLHAKINREILFVGAMTCFHIWDPLSYEQTVESDDVSEHEALSIMSAMGL